jgi:hypothetical protein
MFQCFSPLLAFPPANSNPHSFERTQYHNMHQLWNQPDGKHKSAVDTYGAEHMSRLLGMSCPNPPLPFLFSHKQRY